MSKLKSNRVRRSRKLPPKEARKYDGIRDEMAREFSPGKRSPKHADPQTRMKLGDFFEIQHAISALKAERQRQRLSLADIKKRAGIDRATLSKLETGQLPNPTIATLTRYARALSKEIHIVLADADANAPGD